MSRKQNSSAKSRKHSSSSAKHSKSTSGRHTASKTTTDHNEIREWAEERGGVPASLQGADSPDEIMALRLEFPDAPNSSDENLEEITWEEFFDRFEDQGLALVYEETSESGEGSNSHKLVKRGNAKSAASGR